ncbi:MAG: flagellar hook-basal body complex protein [Thermoleophilia bacterium]|nr:flagellar hook-basal body complex protein [Thermoleophilia bacterium]
MMRGMLAAVSGLKAHEIMMDVTANNIANVNTVGYKSARTSFENAFSQTLRGASGATGALGGTNATQIGLGVQLGGTESLMTEGSIQSTGVPLDCAIQGNGFFRVALWNSATNAFSASKLYTRAGDFTTDTNGYLVTRDGHYVVGYAVDPVTGAVTSPATEQRILINPATTQTVSIDQKGVVWTTDAAGTQRAVGAITLAKFPNENGLVRVEGNLFTASPGSGAEVPGTPDDGSGLGTLVAGALEMSNVDLANEFTSLITAERGFQANSRVITTTDEMLQDLVNLKR